ncbi:efflux RND transporter periplasmic adaptor subunit [Shewanella maritima]|uniref:Efflux RND transporter periplasmic adaptor subunit n=1 Tax=Shewanella maritima TaxID=2520507 RepID=A0A411PJP8_9GAMM|nr:efflux RND transporter periplasmic adaptor subunit [Shewanella maritima]QBF83755.1 efflux RND transporter periplasmic adaptor subunit [Shewanella maritima]
MKSSTTLTKIYRNAHGLTAQNSAATRKLNSTKKLTAALSLIALSCMATGCSDEDMQQAEAALAKVSVQQVSPQAMQLEEEFMGKTQAVHSLEIKPKVSGYIINKAFEDGAEVKAGTLLFEIDPTPFEVEANRLQAVLAQKQALLTMKAKLVNKASALVEQKALSQIELEQLGAEFNMVKAEAKAAEAALDNALLQLSYTKIYAPFDGLVSDSQHTIGSLVGPQSAPLTRLISFDKMHVNIHLDEKDYLNTLQAMAQSGEEITNPAMTLKLANGTHYSHKGEVEFIDNEVDSNNGTIRFRITFPNPDRLLFPGQFVSVTSQQTTPTQAIVVPQNAVQEDQGGRYVLTVNETNTVQAKYLTLGQRVGNDWLVTQGLTSGEQVIVSGLQGVRAGAQVEVEPVIKLANKG